MSDWNAAQYVKDAIAASSTSAHSVHVGAVWATVRPDGVPLADDGWKLHISSRAATFPDLLAKVTPVLLDEGCHFKVARSRRTLAGMNEGMDSPASVGKAVTVYPEADRVRDLGRSLARLLAGHEGPRVLSDLRVDGAAPVYYRYGPFVPTWHVGRRGYLGIGIGGPDGEVFDGLATLEYRQPSWVVDPFANGAEPSEAARPDQSPLLGERYRVSRGIYQSAHGNVYRAVDETTGEDVIVKQARAYVGETTGGADARMRLRNERRVLEACGGLDGVPAIVDHFAHGPDEFLVTGDVGGTNLLYDVQQRGCRLPPGDTGEPESFARAARELAATVAGLHDRGIIMRDITPRNVVVGSSRLWLIDFGLAAMDGVHLRGGTPGFAPMRQRRDEPPRFSDDCHGLGMTLTYMAARRLPITHGTDGDLARRRTLQALTSIYGERHRGFVELVEALLSEDDATSGAALRTLAAGGWQSDRRVGAPAVRLPSAGPAEVTAIERRVFDLVLDQIEEHQLDDSLATFPSLDASIYTGSAGVGLELLHHRDREGVPDAIGRLVTHAVRAARVVGRDRGLFAGSTGIEVFLQAARSAGFDAESPLSAAERRPPTAEELDELGDDVMGGTAGLGLAQLHLYDATGEPAHLEVARRCADHILSRPDLRMSVSDFELPETGGYDVVHGYAHGLAGVVDFLLAHITRTAAPDEVRDEVHARALRLRERAAELAAIAGRPVAAPVSAGWCKGLAGISGALLHAGEVFDDSTLTAEAANGLTVAATWIPRLENLGRCCGAAGLGIALLDCYHVTGDTRQLENARSIVDQFLIRSSGPDEAPLFIDPKGQDAPLSWGMGNAGILTFLRRLHDPGGPDILPSVLPTRVRTLSPERAR